MRTIVVGQTSPDVHQPGYMQLEVWFRFPVAAAHQARFAAANPNYTSSAPSTGDSTADNAETQAFRTGAYFEVYPAENQFANAVAANKLGSQLLDMYATALSAWQTATNVRFQYFGSSYDGAAWTVKSA